MRSCDFFSWLVAGFLLSTILDRSTANFPLPSYLSPLPSSDPDYATLFSSGSQYAVGAPGAGGISEMKVVYFTEEHLVYRVYGGPASECGYWWMLGPSSRDWNDVVCQRVLLIACMRAMHA